MNTNYSKRHQVVSAGNLQNKTNIKKTESDEINQTSCSGKNETFKGGAFLIFCQDSAQKCIQNEILHSLNSSTDSGNWFL